MCLSASRIVSFSVRQSSEIAVLGPRLACSGSIYNLPLDCWIMARILCLPKSFRKLCGISLLSVSERLGVVVELSFEFVLGTPNVMLGGIDRDDGDYVND